MDCENSDPFKLYSVIKGLDEAGMLEQMKKAIKEGMAKYGNISSIQDLKANLAANAIPLFITEMDSARYDEFLSFRRAQMAQKIKQYYDSL